jgi:hypothetical protein
MKLDSLVWLALGRGYWWLVCFRNWSICRGVGYGAHGEPDPGRSNSPAVYIFAGALATVFSRLTSEAGQAKQPMWLDPRLLFRVLTISFIVQKAIVISYVAVGAYTINELSATILRW